MSGLWAWTMAMELDAVEQLRRAARGAAWPVPIAP